MARKQKMKVYHGLPKSITDEHTLAYLDFNDIITNTNWVDPSTTSREYKDSYVGLAYSQAATVPLGNFDLGNNPFTIDVWVENLKSGSAQEPWGCLVGIGTPSTVNSERIDKMFSLLSTKLNMPNSLVIFESGTGTIHSSHLSTDNPLLLRVTFDGISTVTGYVNGKRTNTSTVNAEDLSKWKCNLNYVLGINAGHNLQEPRNSCYVSEVHISNIDRGDYFPNLPQDFIDGKAVIKPRMGQQQIKGDPMYSQVTELKVPNQPYDVLGTIYSDTPDSEGLNVCFNSPELSTASAYEWEPRFGKIRIKGLNGEVISGVIDTDTALCRVLRAIETNHLVVDSIDKLSVGDQLRAIRATDMVPNPSSVYYQITEIHPETSSIVVIRADGGDGWRQSDIDKGYTLAIEITASSSSPTVKTKEGTNVVGTWSGLGTTEATFTLGDNSNIVGKDLYVTYALTMPKGNSDFPEIPHTIERAFGENDIEMKPVDEIMIVDDFKGKVRGDIKECPHIAYRCYMDSLQPPSNINSGNSTTSGFVEATETHLAGFSIEDSKVVDMGVTLQGKIPQALFSFNLIELVERKLGCEIASRDKVQWLKDNLSLITINLKGYCATPSGNTSKFRAYLYNSSTWSSGNIVSSSTIAKSVISISSAIPEVISPEGMVHCLYHSEVASDGVTPSTVYVDYVNIEITLKKDSTYIMLYCDNKRAREDVCNPVLIQKETKTVKRYLPSKEIFSTECLYAKFKNEGVVSGLDILANKHVNIGVTTSEYNKFVNGSKINLNQLPLEKSEHLYTPILDSKVMDSIPNHVGANITELPVIHWWSDNGNKLFTVATTETLNFKTCVNGTNALKGQIGGYKDVNNNIIIYGDVDKSNILTKDGLRLYDISLVNKDGELMLYVIKSSEGNRFYFYNDAITLIKVPNRPLIK